MWNRLGRKWKEKLTENRFVWFGFIGKLVECYEIRTNLFILQQSMVYSAHTPVRIYWIFGVLTMLLYHSYNSHMFPFYVSIYCTVRVRVRVHAFLVSDHILFVNQILYSSLGFLLLIRLCAMAFQVACKIFFLAKSLTMYKCWIVFDTLMTVKHV